MAPVALDGLVRLGVTMVLKNTGVMCSVEVADANREDGVRFIDLGNYFGFNGKRVLLTSLELAKGFGDLVECDIYIRKSND